MNVYTNIGIVGREKYYSKIIKGFSKIFRYI
jgi:hypothetical protein